ncbi:copper transporter [Cellulomonas palmilytica]|uniref:copper transporter n=1 Tax=Cellulomonas palmilytica TaxID=2608402 RepID=UPI001F217F4A|nr:copper transporter [Cellulomonas palmilytica]UJP38824.1 copper transporter [Cellulomonas palmilytica]
MIDFRYHLVSLISVFLALAVGIALGAGPLKETIGDTLTGQVDQLRTEKDELRAQLDATTGDLADARTFVDASGPALLDGALEERRIAVVALGDVPEAERTAVDQRLAESGADVTAHVTLTDAWFDPDLRSYRNALVGLVLENLDPAPADDATLDEQLAQALVQGLTGADPASPDTLTADAGNVLAILSEGDNPMISLADPVTTGADAIVVLAVPVEPAADDAAATPTNEADAEASTDAHVAVLRAAQDLSEGSVLVDGPRGPGSLVDVVLADEALASRLATVSGAELVTGQVTVPLALAARIAGANGHYGFGDGETPLPVPVLLPPVDRTPVTVDPEQEGGQPQGEATATATAGAGG